MKKKTTVSLCMIVKNEEEFILSCINSVKHLVDEIIVVDTGSGDRTVRLAASAGARVFHFNWTGNFAMARNFALEQAVSEWILVLDADELLDPVSIEEFQQLLQTTGIEGYFLPVCSYLNTGREMVYDQVVRLFKNKPTYRFAGAIHEQVAASILKANNSRGLATAPLVIKHYGNLKNQLIKKDKANRNTLIINRELQNNPGDPFLLYSLAVEQYREGNLPAGLANLEKALCHMRGTEGYFEDVLLNTALGLLTLGKLEKLLSFTTQALKMLPDQPDLLLTRGLAHLGLKRYSEAVTDLESTLQNQRSKFLPDFRILCFLGDACILSGNYTRAEEVYLSALKQSSRFLYPLTQILGLFQRGKNTVNIEQVCKFASVREKSTIGQALLGSGDISLAMVVLLLAVYDWAAGSEQNEDMIWLCKELPNIPVKLKPLYERDLSLHYVLVTSREIFAYILIIAKGYDCCHFHARSMLKSLVEKTLLILITEFCPPWYPQFFLGHGGIYNNDRSPNCLCHENKK